MEWGAGGGDKNTNILLRSGVNSANIFKDFGRRSAGKLNFHCR
jgi:hypothetical protein